MQIEIVRVFTWAALSSVQVLLLQVSRESVGYLNRERTKHVQYPSL